ncbi:MAG: PAS domain S-box protein [Actinobacteria bacterium]|nr:MAG: PAS domain S-box protein [Actinomycetota bacterium]
MPRRHKEERIQVLLLEDVEADARLIERELAKRGVEAKTKRVDTEPDFVRELEAFEPDVILADYALPSFNGIAALKIARRAKPDTPFIFVSGAIGEELAIECLKLGAADYVLKDRISRLGPAVRRALREQRQSDQRREAMEALSRHLELMSRVTETSPVPIVVLDRRGYVIFANKRAEQLFGLTRSRVIGRRRSRRDWCIDDFAGRRLSEEELPVAQVIASGRSVWNVRHSVVGADGHGMVLSINASPLESCDGDVEGVVMTLEDITEKSEMEEGLAWLASFPDLNPNPVVEIATDGAVSYVNPSAKRLLPGLEKEGFSHPVLGGLEVLAQEVRAGRGGEAIDEVKWSETLFHRTACPVPGRDRLRVYLVDITSCLKAEEALEASEHRYRRLVEASPDGVGVVRRDEIVYANTALATLLGAASPLEIVGRSILDFVEKDMQPDLADRLRALIQERDTPPLVEARLVRMDGTVVDVEIADIPFTFHGEPAAQLVARDITERKRVDQLKSDLIATISHELRTPLAVISGYSTLLSRAGNNPEAVEKAVGKIRDRTAAMTRLVERVLDTSQIQAGTFSLALDVVDIGALVRRCAHSVPLTEHHRLQVRVPGGLPRVQCDPPRLCMAVSNLVDNAVKFSPGGGVVRVSMSHRGDTIRIAVADSGIGIAHSDLKRIFDRFTQVDMSQTRPFGGTGMGLHIVRQIVERHGGHIEVRATPGKGSTFTIDVPVTAVVTRQEETLQADRMAARARRRLRSVAHGSHRKAS